MESICYYSNHRTGEIVPVAEYIISGGVVQRKVPFEFIPFLNARTDQEREAAYNPSVIMPAESPNYPKIQMTYCV